MANEKNLKKPTPKEARENGRKGGIASGKARQRKKELRECFEVVLNTEIRGKDGEVKTGAEAMAAKLFKAIMTEKDTAKLARAIEIFRDTAGQKPVEKVMIAEVDPDVVAEVERMVTSCGDETD